MSKYLPAKYYQSLSKEDKEKKGQYGREKIYQKMENKSFFNIEKKIIK